MGARAFRTAVAAAALALAPAALGAVTTTPAGLSVARGQATAVAIRYDVATAAAGGVVSSPGGLFRLPDGSTVPNATPMSIAVTGGRGSATETVVISPAVVERGLGPTSPVGRGAFTYERAFSSGDVAVVQITVSSPAAASFSAVRVELYFDGRRGETTVARRAPLVAYADVTVSGSGILQGYWEVDGRFLARFDQLVTFGSTATVRTPDVPALPTFDAGTHLVRLVLTAPASAVPPPALLYYVTGEGSPVRIVLRAPDEGAEVRREAATFAWDPPDGAALFLVRYVDCQDGRVVASALTRDAAYAMPRRLVDERLRSGRYCWTVTGFDDGGAPIGESAARSFAVGP